MINKKDSPITIATMTSLISHVNDQNVNPTCKAYVITSEQEEKIVYCKSIPARSVFVECLCAVIGRSVGIPIPKPCLILVDPQFLGEPEGSESKIFFGSEDADYPSIRRPYNYYKLQNDHLAADFLSIMADKLLDFKESKNVSVFDEWIANEDRNIGNILYDGNDEFFFIDHEKSLPTGLHFDTAANKNLLIDYLYTSKEDTFKTKLLHTIDKEVLPFYRTLPLDDLVEKSSSGVYPNKDLTMNEMGNILEFLTDRLPLVGSLVQNRMQTKQQCLVL